MSFFQKMENANGEGMGQVAARKLECSFFNLIILGPWFYR